MKLYVMRHGPAEDRAASGRDFDRALTPSGRDRVRDVARVLVAEKEEPLVIFSSPLVRALQTAEIVAAVTKLGDRGGQVSTRRELSPGGESPVLARTLAAEGAKRVMFVGHEPDFAELVALLSGRHLPTGMQKAMVVGLSSVKGDPAAQMRLRFVLDPKSLAFDPDARAS